MENAASPSSTDQYIYLGGRKASRIWFPDIPLFESTESALMSDFDFYNEERCGLISSHSQQLFYVENVHEEPKNNFFMDHEEYDLALEEIFEIGETVLGVFHTHPNNIVWPSPRDIKGWPDPSLSWRYWVVTRTEVLEWELL